MTGQAKLRADVSRAEQSRGKPCGGPQTRMLYGHVCVVAFMGSSSRG
jgi:hypothetical protein